MSAYDAYVKLVNEASHKEYDADGLHMLLDYIFRFNKTWLDTHRAQRIDREFNGCEPFFFFPKWEEHNPEKIYQLMLLNQKLLRPLDMERLAKHRIISFPPDDMLLASDLNILGRQLALFYSRCGYIAAYSVQVDTANMHIHLVVSGCSYIDGRRFSIPFEYNQIQNIISDWHQKHDDLMKRSFRYHNKREDAYYGTDLRYESIPLSFEEQMALNRRNKGFR